MTKHENHHAFRSDATLSLLPLRMVLTNARKGLPPSTLKLQPDINEELALRLIEKMQTDYKKPLPPVNLKGESGQYRHNARLGKMVSTDA